MSSWWARLAEASEGLRVATCIVILLVLDSVVITFDQENQIHQLMPEWFAGWLIAASVTAVWFLVYTYAKRLRSFSELATSDSAPVLVDQRILDRWAAVCEDYDIDPEDEPRARIECFPVELTQILALEDARKMERQPCGMQERLAEQVLEIMDDCLRPLAVVRETEAVGQEAAAAFHADQMLKATGA